MDEKSEIVQVNLEDIIPNRFQPRLNFDDKALNDLASSIKEHGIIQPLVLRKIGDKYEIIAGERRYKASGIAGLRTVPAIITNIDDNTSAELAIVENVQRKDLTAIEEALSYKKLLDRDYLTQEQLAQKMGVSQSSIANKLRLLNLDEEIQKALLNEQISERHARSLLSLTDKEVQKQLLRRIINERMTVRQLDSEIKNITGVNQEEEEIPIVQITPNVDEIKNNAIDLNPVQEIANTQDLLKSNQEISGVEPTPQVEQKENKFFNFLEDAPANMNMEQPTYAPSAEQPMSLPELNKDNINTELIADFEPDSIHQPTTETLNLFQEQQPVETVSQTNEEAINLFEPHQNKFIPTENMFDTPSSPLMETENQNSDNLEVNIYDVPSSPLITNEKQGLDNVITNESVPSLETNTLNNHQINQPEVLDFTNSIESLDFGFSTPVEEQPVVEESHITNQSEESTFISPFANEDIIDPVNLIGQEEQTTNLSPGININTAISTMRNTVKELEQKGFYVETEEIDFEKIYQIVVKIEK